ncbi:MAG: TspO/MBR family protein [Hyphococcus sp.]
MNRKPLLVGVLAAAAVAVIGGSMTKIGPWYEALEKPALNPPNWLFAPAWTIIYALAVFAGVTAWRDARNVRDRAHIASLFFINALLNILWSAFFFTVQRPDWAFAEVITLWLSVAALIVVIRRFSPPAALALWPYLLWVTFAAYLNYAIVRLNGPFG